MPGKIDFVVNPDKQSLNFTLSTEGVSQSLTLSTAEVNQLLQTLGEARMGMTPMRQPKPRPTDRFQGTINPTVQLFPARTRTQFFSCFWTSTTGCWDSSFKPTSGRNW